MRLPCLLALLVLTAFGQVSEAAEKILSPNDNIRITLSRGRSVSNVTGGSIGEKLAAFEPVVKIQNGSISDFNKNRVCVIMMGEDTTQKNRWKVIYRREYDADLLASKTHEWVGEPFQQGFDRTMAKSGFDYAGYIVLIKNSEGEPVIVAQTKSFWAADLQKAWDLQEGSEYERTHFKK